MSKDLEKQIEEAAKLTSSPSAFMLGFNYGKEYWQQEMYSKEEIKALLCDIGEYDDTTWRRCKEWFEQNKKK